MTLDVAFGRLLAVLARLWPRLIGPPGLRLLAPVLGALAFAAGWRLWRRAERTALGRAVRWWGLATAGVLLAAGVVYLQAALPDDPEAAVVARTLAAERPGRSALPAPVAAGGALAAALAALAAGWRWRSAHLSSAERTRLAGEWRAVRQRGQRRLLLPAAAALTLAVAAGAATAVGAAAGPPQIPAPIGDAGAAAGPGLATSPGARPTLWVGTSAGVSRLVPAASGAAWQTLRRPHVPLPSNRVTAIAPGPAGEVWIATHGGLARYAPAADGARWQTATVESAGLPYPTVLGLAVDRRGAAWAATGHGGAAIDPHGNARAFTALNAPLLHQILDAAYVDSAGRVWFGGAGGVNVFQPPATSDGAGDWPVGFTRYATGGALPDDLVFTIFGDSKGRVWFGTRRGAAVLTPAPDAFGLGAYDSARWQTFTAADAPLLDTGVHAIVEDRQGRIWLGTEGGISVLDEAVSPPAASRWRHFTARAGGAPTAGELPHAWVQVLALGPDGRIWAGTRGGLAVYDPARPDQGWLRYTAHPLRRWTGYLWPPHWQQNVISDDVTALAWVP